MLAGLGLAVFLGSARRSSAHGSWRRRRRPESRPTPGRGTRSSRQRKKEGRGRLVVLRRPRRGHRAAEPRVRAAVRHPHRALARAHRRLRGALERRARGGQAQHRRPLLGEPGEPAARGARPRPIVRHAARAAGGGRPVDRGPAGRREGRQRPHAAHHRGRLFPPRQQQARTAGDGAPELQGSRGPEVQGADRALRARSGRRRARGGPPMRGARTATST